MSDIVLYETDGRSAVITLNRPEARNAVSQELAEALEAAVERFEADDDLWTGILTATPPVFCAGADLKAVAKGGSRLGTKRGGFGGIVLLPRTKPLIAAVDGAAVAGGFEITLACDLVVASTRAVFGIPEVKRSLVAAAGGLARLPRKIPVNLAMELALTGDTITAERAHELGLVNRLCEPGQVVEEAKELAEAINVNAPLAVRSSRQAVLDTPAMTDDEAMRVAGNMISELASTEDFAEGPRAFIEKRSPSWNGR